MQAPEKIKCTRNDDNSFTTSGGGDIEAVYCYSSGAFHYYRTVEPADSPLAKWAAARDAAPRNEREAWLVAHPRPAAPRLGGHLVVTSVKAPAPTTTAKKERKPTDETESPPTQ